jgi:phosphoribosylamine--glycine ligase
MDEDDNKFSGVVYPGLMLTNDGPKILEYNARFGDPETQTYVRLLDTDLLDIIDACIDGTLDKVEIKWKNLSACTIVLASGGYPENYEKGKIISGIVEAEQDKDIIVFHAGTKYDENKNLITNGGRVLGVTAIGNNLEEALNKTYKAVEKIQFEGMYYRKDIGKKALNISIVF